LQEKDIPKTNGTSVPNNEGGTHQSPQVVC